MIPDLNNMRTIRGSKQTHVVAAGDTTHRCPEVIAPRLGDSNKVVP